MRFTISSKKREDVIDITDNVKDAVKNVKDGIVVVYVPHATASIIINENYDPNINLDFQEALEKLIPKGKWLHDKIDGNADAHIKAAIIGPSETLIIEEGKLLLGQWQNIMLADFDGPRERTVIVAVRQ
tara:strand:- start:647 stop:1033 length:387 start_codon:yes stop_codon:yes gene_type:complete